MGMYDTVWINEDEGIQFKSGQQLCHHYDVGDKIEVRDGIHFGWEGAFVVYNRKVIAVFSIEKPFMFDKWGGAIQYPDLNNTYK